VNVIFLLYNQIFRDERSRKTIREIIKKYLKNNSRNQNMI